MTEEEIRDIVFIASLLRRKKKTRKRKRKNCRRMELKSFPFYYRSLMCRK